MAFNQGGSGSSSISGANDVALSGAADAQLLAYDASVQKWKNAARPAIVPVLSTASSRPSVPAGSVVMIIGGTARPSWSAPGDLWAREG